MLQVGYLFGFLTDSVGDRSGGRSEDVIDSSENLPPKPGNFIFNGSKFF